MQNTTNINPQQPDTLKTTATRLSELIAYLITKFCREEVF